MGSRTLHVKLSGTSRETCLPFASLGGLRFRRRHPNVDDSQGFSATIVNHRFVNGTQDCLVGRAAVRACNSRPSVSSRLFRRNSPPRHHFSTPKVLTAFAKLRVT